MKIKMQHDCMDKDCKTVTLTGPNVDGMRCPRCGGPVLPKHYKPIVWKDKRKELISDIESGN